MTANLRKGKMITGEKKNEICQNLDEDTTNPSTSTFPNRMAKTRALKKTNEALPKTPEKKAELFEAISSSPQTRKILQKKGIIKYPTEMKETMALCAPAADISEGADHVKKSRSKDK